MEDIIITIVVTVIATLIVKWILEKIRKGESVTLIPKPGGGTKFIGDSDKTLNMTDFLELMGKENTRKPEIAAAGETKVDAQKSELKSSDTGEPDVFRDKLDTGLWANREHWITGSTAKVPSYRDLIVLLSGIRVNERDRSRAITVAEHLLEPFLEDKWHLLSESDIRIVVERSADRLWKDYMNKRKILKQSTKEAAEQAINDELAFLEQTLNPQ
jgi:hypothetical protein